MISASLTAKRVGLEGGATAYPYEWNGHVVPIADGAGTVLRTMDRVGRASGNQEKLDLLAAALLPDMQRAARACGDAQEFGRFLSAALRDVWGVEVGSGRTSAPLWDADEDAAAIRISLRMVYGIDWDEVRESIPWCEFIALVFGLPLSTPLGRAIYYRNLDNRPEDGQRAAEFDRMHALLALGSGDDEAMRSDAAMSDMALGLMRKAASDE